MNDKPSNNESIPIDIEKEVKTSYLNYAMSVIVSRAIPDARDGLKPVHRRTLYTMFESGLHHNTQTRKCARIVGGVISNYHPHGPDSVYLALVRLSQSFSMRYPLIIGQGNFGSIDGDPPAAYRYTEAKLEQISEELLSDIKKETVDFIPNYDESTTEPVVLPGSLPFLLLNGSTGIAVGLTTEVPPHNLRELSEAIIQQVDNPNIDFEELCKIVKGPDFPTGAIIKGLSGIRQAFKTGHGSITIQSRYTIEESNGYQQIVFTEIPYAKRKSEIIARLANLVNNETIIGIRDIRDLSNSKGISIVVQLKKDVNVQLTLQKILVLTDFQASYSINCTALVQGQPRTLGLKECLQIFIDHRIEVINRKTAHDLREAKKRAHIVSGLLIALQSIDEVVALIKSSRDAKEAQQKLMQNFTLDEIQAKAILDMRLHRLTSLETNKLEEEMKQLALLIADLEDILANPERVKTIIKDTLRTLTQKYGDDRRTEIQASEAISLSEEELIDEEGMLVTLTKNGYIKRTNISNFDVQNRGGKGKLGTSLGKEDSLDKLYMGSTHDLVLFITSQGRGFVQKIFQIPESGRTSRGTSIHALLPLEGEEHITSILSIPPFSENFFLILSTAQGKTKKLVGNQLKGTTRKSGLRLLSLQNDDFVVGSNIITQETNDIFLFTRFGKVLRMKTQAIRTMGREAAGVRGINLKKDDTLVAVVTGDDATIFSLISEKGYSKRFRASDLMPHNRGTAGVVCMAISEITGTLCAALQTTENDIISAISKKGKTIRFTASSSTLQGRTSRGVITFTLEDDNQITSAVVSNLLE